MESNAWNAEKWTIFSLKRKKTKDYLYYLQILLQSQRKNAFTYYVAIFWQFKNSNIYDLSKPWNSFKCATSPYILTSFLFALFLPVSPSASTSASTSTSGLLSLESKPWRVLYIYGWNWWRWKWFPFLPTKPWRFFLILSFKVLLFGKECLKCWQINNLFIEDKKKTKEFFILPPDFTAITKQNASTYYDAIFFDNFKTQKYMIFKKNLKWKQMTNNIIWMPDFFA